MIDVLKTDGMHESDILPFVDVDGRLCGQYSPVRYRWFSDNWRCILKSFLITCQTGFCKLSIICCIC